MWLPMRVGWMEEGNTEENRVGNKTSALWYTVLTLEFVYALYKKEIKKRKSPKQMNLSTEQGVRVWRSAYLMPRNSMVKLMVGMPRSTLTLSHCQPSHPREGSGKKICHQWETPGQFPVVISLVLNYKYSGSNI